MIDFNKKEKISIFISGVIISLLFLITFPVNNIIGSFFLYLILIIFTLFIKLLITKKIANKYNCNVTFKLNYNLLIIGIIISLFTLGSFVFPVIGVITITAGIRLGKTFTRITRKEKAKISIAPIIVNLALSLLSIVLYPISNEFFTILFLINIQMAIGELIPIPPLNGVKIFIWSRITWLSLMGSALFLFLSERIFGNNLIFSIIGIIIISIISFLQLQE